MHRFSFSHLSDGDLLQSARHEFGCRRLATARFLAQLAEIDARKLYLPLAFGSLHAFCVGEFRMAEQQAYKWIQVTRAGRRFPAVLEAIADGGLSRSGAVVLAPHLTEENVAELLKEAAFKSKSEVERLVSRQTRKNVEANGPATLELSPGTVDGTAQLSPGIVSPPPETNAPTTLADLAPETRPLQVRLDEEALQLLRYAQALLGHAEPSRDTSKIFKRSLKALVAELEKRKFGAGSKRRGKGGGATDRRHIPLHVRNAVWTRDGGRCTFVSLTGKRCDCTGLLEFDHIIPVAKGGESTVPNVRLLCRAHNQYEPEREFGKDFMKGKRQAAAEAREATRTRSAAARKQTESQARCEEVVPWLRQLGFGGKEASQAAARTESMSGAPLEERVRFAISSLARPARQAVPRAEAIGIPGA